jgi:recombination protein RecA
MKMVKKREATKDILDLIEEKFPSLLIKKEADRIEAIPTGSLSLDVSLGVGGIPVRRFTEIYGAESSGKTTLALSIAKNALNQNRKVLYIDSEHGVDMGRAEVLVGDVVYDDSRFLLLQPETMEQAMEIAEKAIRTGDFGLVVVDSLASMLPNKVKDGELEDQHMALLARNLGQFAKRNLYSIRQNDVAFLGINQVRDKFGAFFQTYVSPGGHEWKHECSVIVMLSKGKEITISGEKVGILSKFVVKKNKLAPPFRSYEIPFLFESGVDEYRDIVNFAKDMGVLKKAGSYYVFEDEALAIGLVKTMEYLKNNKDVLDKIVKACYDITTVSKVYEEEGEYVEENG